MSKAHYSARGTLTLLTAAVLGSAAIFSTIGMGMASAQGSAPTSSGSSSSIAAPPDIQQVEGMIQDRTGMKIQWTDVHGWTGNPSFSRQQRLSLTGTGTLPSGQDIVIECHASYPPLKIGCTITFNL